MLSPGSGAAGLVLVIWCDVAWGLWPLLRMKCGAAVPVFALLNMSAQALGAALWGLTLGTLVDPDRGETFTTELALLFQNGLELRDAAVFFGGFCLGHGDHISAVAMQFLPAGVVYPVYAGLIVAAGGILNFAQAPPSSPPLLFAGFLLVLCAICLLAIAERLHHADQQIKQPDQHGTSSPGSSADETDDVYRPLEAHFHTDARGRIHNLGGRINGGSLASSMPVLPSRPALRSALLQGSLLAVSGSDSALINKKKKIPRGSSFLGAITGQWVPPPTDGSEDAHLSFNQALLVILAGAACACVWSPLATFGTKPAAGNVVANPYVCLFVFASGQLCSLPTVALIAGRIGGTGAIAPCRQLSWPVAGWGVLCGLMVSSGYCAFFVGSQAASPTVAFGIAHCSPLVSLLIEVCWVGSFQDATSRVKACLVLCVLLYFAAIGFLMLSNSV